jgi:hypothetical protein
MLGKHLTKRFVFAVVATTSARSMTIGKVNRLVFESVVCNRGAQTGVYSFFIAFPDRIRDTEFGCIRPRPSIRRDDPLWGRSYEAS